MYNLRTFEEFSFGNKKFTIPLYFDGNEKVFFEVEKVEKYNNIFRFELGFHHPEYDMDIELDYDPTTKDINIYDLKVDGGRGKSNVSETEETSTYIEKYLIKNNF